MNSMTGVLPTICPQTLVTKHTQSLSQFPLVSPSVYDRSPPTRANCEVAAGIYGYNCHDDMRGVQRLDEQFAPVRPWETNTSQIASMQASKRPSVCPLETNISQNLSMHTPIGPLGKNISQVPNMRTPVRPWEKNSQIPRMHGDILSKCRYLSSPNPRNNITLQTATNIRSPSGQYHSAVAHSVPMSRQYEAEGACDLMCNAYTGPHTSVMLSGAFLPVTPFTLGLTSPIHWAIATPPLHAYVGVI